jgi:hypothetical protein
MDMGGPGYVVCNARLELVRAYYRIRDGGLRKKLLELVRDLGPKDAGKPPDLPHPAGFEKRNWTSSDRARWVSEAGLGPAGSHSDLVPRQTFGLRPLPHLGCNRVGYGAPNPPSAKSVFQASTTRPAPFCVCTHSAHVNS